MKRIVSEQKEIISINDINTELHFILVKVENELLNYTSRGLSYLMGGEPYTKANLEELIEGGAEAYQIESSKEAEQWIKDNL